MSKPFWQEISVQNFRTLTVIKFMVALSTAAKKALSGGWWWGSADQEFIVGAGLICASKYHCKKFITHTTDNKIGMLKQYYIN